MGGVKSGVNDRCAAAKVGHRVAASTPPLKHQDISKEAPLRLPKPLSDQFPVCVYARVLFVYKPSVNGRCEDQV